MTQAISSPPLSGCSLPSSEDGEPIAQRISRTYERLQLVMEEEAALKKSLYELLTEQVAQAAEQLEQAQTHCKFIMEKQAEMRKNLGEGMESLKAPPSGFLHSPRPDSLDSASAFGDSNPQSSISGASEISSGHGLSECMSRVSSPISVTRSGSVSRTSSISPEERGRSRTLNSSRETKQRTRSTEPIPFLDNDFDAPPLIRPPPGMWISSHQRDQLMEWFHSMQSVVPTHDLTDQAPAFLRCLARKVQGDTERRNSGRRVSQESGFSAPRSRDCREPGNSVTLRRAASSMSAMTHTSISECSFPDSEVDTLDDSIERTCSKMRTALEGFVLLQKQLRELVAMRKENAIEQFNKAKQHLELIEKQESALSIFLGKDGMSSSFISHHEEGDDSEVGKDLVDQSQNAQNDHPDIDLEIHQVSLEGQYPDLDSMITGGDVVSKDGIGDEVPGHKDGEGEGSNPLPLLDDSADLERLDSATINDKINSYRMQIDILEEERRRREEALALAMVAKADEELLTLQAEREAIRERWGMITDRERELILQSEEGQRLASLWAPGSKEPRD